MAQVQSVSGKGIGKGERGGVISEERFGPVSEGFSRIIQSVGKFSRVRFVDSVEVVCFRLYMSLFFS